MLSYEKLDVYQCGIEFLAKSSKFIEGIPKGNAVLVDQLRRAALSITLNIAEGSGRPSKKDAARFYAIARGSAMECGAILDASLVLKLIEATEHAVLKCLIERIVSMLTKMV